MSSFLSEVHAGRCPPGAGTWTTSIRLLNQTKVKVDDDGDFCFDEVRWKVKHHRETSLGRVGSQVRSPQLKFPLMLCTDLARVLFIS